MGDKIFYVKVKISGEGAWSGTPLRVTADNHLDAERMAKRAFAEQMKVTTSEVDVHAFRFDAKSVWKGGL